MSRSTYNSPASSTLDLTSVLSHKEYRYRAPDWKFVRDMVEGERAVKEQGKAYLPALSRDVTDDEYRAYLDRAVYVNLTERTVKSLAGRVFRKHPKVSIPGMKPDKVRALTEVWDDTGGDLTQFGQRLVQELLIAGRVGMLVDRQGTSDPYVTLYVAESVLNWRYEMRKGRSVLTYVLLKENIEDVVVPTSLDIKSVFSPSLTKSENGVGLVPTYRYRALVLNPLGEYEQHIFKPFYDEKLKIDIIGSPPDEVIKPTRVGVPLTEIPFWIVTSEGIRGEVTKPPVLDIARLNLDHYRTSADLEHGRKFCGSPIYWVSSAHGNENDTYRLGSSHVWEIGPDARAGILEMFGTGLRALENALKERELHIAQLGGKLAISGSGSGENADVFAEKKATEISVLLSVTQAASLALTRALRAILYWRNIDKFEKASVTLNEDFKSLNIAARELRAVALLYKEGVLPIGQVFRTLQEAEYLDETMTEEDFRSQLDSVVKEFPNNPDAEARSEGYSDAMQRQQHEQHDETLKLAIKAQKDAVNKTGVAKPPAIPPTN